MENTTYTTAPSGDRHTHTIILLHGRDSHGSEFASDFFESQASDERKFPEIFPTIKWVFPSSKLLPSARFQSEISQWFDIWSVEDPADKKELQLEGLRESIRDVLVIVRSEMALVPPERIILGGISQGCATAILALLCGGIRIGGFVGMSSWLPFQGEVAAVARDFERGERLGHIRSIFNESIGSPEIVREGDGSAIDTPVFLSHSKDDMVVPIKNGVELEKMLRELGVEVTWKAYEDGDHWINEPEGVDDIVAFLKDRLQIGS
ncbi:hypothetical protein EG329_007488 [Mollisiaceae sp. DMI_Dod_QoI]|nr:hypothetical protein EG329_007488 [Helotiales sp. DMI_Dod_QoI]